MTSRERVGRMLRHREADRVPVHDVPWELTVRRWWGEGLPEGVSPADHFGYELAYQGPDISLQLPERTLEETETYRVYTDSKGAVLKSFKDHESVPENIDFTITSPETWEQHKHRWEWNDDRVGWEAALAYNRALREKGKFVCYFAHMGYDWIQRMCGPETVLAAMAENPAWVKDMVDTLMDLVLRGAEEMLQRGFEFDGAFIADDMGYKNGTLFSPRTYRELEFPAQKRFCDFMNERDLPVILHSCGNVSQFVPMLIEAGFSCWQPLEVKAGVDMLALKREYGDKLCFMGGIDARAMAAPDPAVIEAEIAGKLPLVKEGGGYIYHSDHSVPNDVSYAQYRRVMDLVREYGRYG